jgi:uncharacterized protein (TIGR00297 family)
VDGAAFLLPAAAAAWAARLVDTGGAVTGWILTSLLYAASGWPGAGVFGAFFAVAAASTGAGWTRKAALGLAQGRDGRRSAGHAVANTLAGVVSAALSLVAGHRDLLMVAMTASFATAAFDTVASEIGQAFGRRHFLATTLRPVPPGTEGAISLTGTAAGATAAIVVALVGAAVGVVSLPGALAVFAGAVVGALGESILGAALPGDGRQRGHVLNLANTVVGAATAAALVTALPL